MPSFYLNLRVTLSRGKDDQGTEYFCKLMVAPRHLSSGCGTSQSPKDQVDNIPQRKLEVMDISLL